MTLTLREGARYRAIVRRLEKLRGDGYTPETHPDFEPLQAELSLLAEKMTAPKEPS